MEVDGEPTPLSAESLLGLRLDYQVGDTYPVAALFHGPFQGGPVLYSADRASPFPWGSGRQADRVEQVEDLARFEIDVAASAPASWTGRAQISAIMQDCGRGARAKIVLRTAR